MQQALAVSTDSEHRFELALQLGELKIAYQLAVEAEVRQHVKRNTGIFWDKLGIIAVLECKGSVEKFGYLQTYSIWRPTV